MELYNDQEKAKKKKDKNEVYIFADDYYVLVDPADMTKRENWKRFPDPETKKKWPSDLNWANEVEDRKSESSNNFRKEKTKDKICQPDPKYKWTNQNSKKRLELYHPTNQLPEKNNTKMYKNEMKIGKDKRMSHS